MFSIMANCFTWIKRRREPIKKVTLLMVGLDNAGKTSTVADLKGDSLEGITPTVGFLTSEVSMYRFNVTIYDIGGGSRIRPIWKNYFSEAYGVVFVVDASDRQRLDECRDALHESLNSDKVYGKPILILANKQDIKGAMGKDEVYDQLDLDALSSRNKAKCEVYTCTALLGQGPKIDRQIKKGFQWLLQEISLNYIHLSQRVEKDYSEQKKKAAEERKRKLERIRREKEEREKAEKEAAEKAANQEESDDDVVVGGKSPRGKDVPTQQKRRSKKKQLQRSIQHSSEENVQIEPTKQKKGERETHNAQDNRLTARNRLTPIEHETDETDLKKKKRKKKKHKNNKTAPIDDEMELETKSKRNTSAWEESGTRTMNGFTGGNSPRRLEPLRRSPTVKDRSSINPSDGEDDSEESGPVSRSRSPWARSRPNSEDHDIVT